MLSNGKVLRVAVTYPENSWVYENASRLSKKRLGRKLSKENYRKLLKGRAKEIDTEEITLVPETYLTSAFWKIEKDYGVKLAPTPLTLPEIYYEDSTLSLMYYTRNYLSRCKDLKLIINFFATTLALGVYFLLDSDNKDLCVEEGHAVKIDPNFAVTSSLPHVYHREMEDIRSSYLLLPSAVERLKDERKRWRKEYGLSNEVLLEYLSAVSKVT